MTIYLGKHKKNRIRVDFHYSKDRVKKIKKVSGGKYDPDGKFWTVPCDNKTLKFLFKLFDDESVKTSSELKILIWQKCLRKELSLQGYSRKTIKSYKSQLHRFLDFHYKDPREINLPEIKEYLSSLVDSDSCSVSYVNQAISAIKVFYKYVLNSEINLDFALNRPKKRKRLPKVLSKNDVMKIINATTNLKHKTILAIIYSSGLRVSEVTHLKLNHFYFKREMLFIEKAKGKKDRYTIISEFAINLIEEYLNKYEVGEWLFPGREDKPISERSVQKVFKNALKKRE